MDNVEKFRAVRRLSIVLKIAAVVIAVFLIYKNL